VEAIGSTKRWNLVDERQDKEAGRASLNNVQGLTKGQIHLNL
jgi:hypothetical protein